jgi:sporulation protein YlmC with PRC-barrel domain
MKFQSTLLVGAFLAVSLPLLPGAEPMTPTNPASLGRDKQAERLIDIEVKNFQDEPIGRVKELGLDLVNGRIVEVLLVSGEFLGMGGKVVAVPPGALYQDPVNGIYRLNMNVERFKEAPVIDLSKWSDHGRSDRVAAAYRFFGQEPYFLEEGVTPSKTATRPKVLLGYVERSSKILDLVVKNHQGEKLGQVWALTFDLPNGRIRSVIVVAPGVAKTKSIIPAMALSFNADRDGLLLDNSKLEYDNEPRFVFEEAAHGQGASYQEESYSGPRTSVALEQGSSYRDVDRTVLINKNMREAKINARNVEVGTINGRVTLRGWVDTAEDKRRIGEIAIAASRLELVDNQIKVGRPGAGK